ncbi:Transcriptional regulator MraZ [Candidatus Entotheonellaceae bacterium PAL068K]
MHFMMSDVVEIEIDRASRVLIRRKWRQDAGIDVEVILVGRYDRLETWGNSIWQSHLNELEEEHELSLSKVLNMPSIKPSVPGEQSVL